MVSLHCAQDNPSKSCFCYNPHLNTTNGTLPCDIVGCSRGNNSGCYVIADGYATSNIDKLRSFIYIVYDGNGDVYAVFEDCNCPGFKYNDSMGNDNAIIFIRNGDGNGDKNDYIYNYTTCHDFGDVYLSNAAACCHYCCGTLYVPNTTHRRNPIKYDMKQAKKY